jgi:outer membrane immunogenic protein
VTGTFVPQAALAGRAGPTERTKRGGVVPDRFDESRALTVAVAQHRLLNASATARRGGFLPGACLVVVPRSTDGDVEFWGRTMRSVKSAFAIAGVVLAGTSFATGAALAANWTGFYAGAQGGYSNLTDSEGNDNYPVPTVAYGGNGASIGVFAGYNYQLGNLFVLGVDGEVNWENAASQFDLKTYGGPEDQETWSAAIRAKLGVIVSPSVLLFATAGYTAAGFDMSHDYFSTYDGNKWTGTGAQFGVGASTQLTDNLLGNVEVTYSNYGRHTLTDQNVPGYYSADESVWSAKAGLAWKFSAAGDNAPTTGSEATAPAGDWTGFYLGAQGGYTNLNASEDYLSPSLQQNPYWTANGNGVSVGAFGGYNYQLNNLFVLGVDGELNWENAALNNDNADSGIYGTEKWSAALRAKFGVVLSPQVLVFATAGYTAAAFDYSQGYWRDKDSPWTGSAAQFGVGATAKLTDNLLANLEVTYARFGTHTIAYAGAPYFTVTPTNVSAKAGLAWKFQ